jgi:exonuclease SbcD
MKIIHFADAHIGVETYGSIDPATGLSTRVQDELRAVDQVIDFAIVNGADLVLFCGDAYRSREPSPTLQREFAARIKRLSRAHIPTVLVAGNHDLAGSPGRASSVDIFDTLDIEYIHIAARPAVLNIATGNGEVQVAVLPWLRRNALLARETARDLEVADLTAHMQEALAAVLADLAGSIDPARPALLAAHVAVASARAGTEKAMVIGNDPVVMLSTIANPVYDYIALGHMHRRQELSGGPPVVYAGSLERLDFGDEADEKGFYVVDIEAGDRGKNACYSFHPTDARRFMTIELCVGEEEADPTAAVLRGLEDRLDDIKDAVVRLKVSLPGRKAGVLGTAGILKALKEAYNVSVIVEAGRSARIRSAGWAGKSLTPLEALDKYMESNNVPEERRRKLREYAGKVIEEEFSGEIETYAG